LTGNRNEDKLGPAVNSEPVVLQETDDFIVIDKPPGWLSIPAREPKATDLVVSGFLSAAGMTPLMIHRLDRFTSGVMIVAKNPAFHRTANSWFEKRIVKKTYHFLASPPPSRPAIQIKTPVEGKPAQTLFEILEKTGDAFYGKATPLTGRFHQIRAHAADAGFPLLGDVAFGGRPAPRVCLHAHSLETPAGMFTAPLAADLAGLWKGISG
jgi:tRNA pseudouridine32 synthase/23S rRNA pseudouridine746 synthase